MEQAPVTEAAPAEPVEAEPPVSKPVVVAGHRHATAPMTPCASSGLCPGSTASQHLGAPAVRL
ncbi:hypothetical protein LNO89_05775 [Klebsiella pneumoniae subsp. pneumoniae]|nr:hypothetical protein [Klebsiella pneumoniae subsp. pneumoniae]